MNHRPAFTLIELAVVVAIIAILIALLLPAVQSARSAARLAMCSNNLLQLGIALGNYASLHRVFPPGVVNDKGPVLNLPTGYHFSWVVQILPFIGQNNVYQRFDFSQSVYHPANLTAREVRIATFWCPQNGRRSAVGYVGCHNDVEAPIDATNHGVLYLNSRVSYDDITDGSQFTILVGEINGTSPTLGWASGTRATLRNTGRPINEPEIGLSASGTPASSPGLTAKRSELDAIESLVTGGLLPIGYSGGFSSWHSGAANFLLCDGSVRLLHDSIDQVVYRRLGNRSDGEMVSGDEF
jgi:prepilin-type N-terminal cleavage/methylation domain-containing protein/prepilin-type processing-associated H-X9-DG protein